MASLTKEEKIEKLKYCAQLLERIIGDTAIPRNIRRVAEEARNILLDEEKGPGLRASTVISMLDEITNDPNMPLHARTLIWNIIGELESVAVED